MANLPIIEAPSFKARVSQEGERITARLVGTADMRVQATLQDFLAALHQVATGATAEVLVDLTDVEFMNSSSLTSFVHWMDDRDREPRGTYRITFKSNPKHRWQQRSLHSLTALGYAFVSVTETP